MKFYYRALQMKGFFPAMGTSNIASKKIHGKAYYADWDMGRQAYRATTKRVSGHPPQGQTRAFGPTYRVSRTPSFLALLRFWRARSSFHTVGAFSNVPTRVLAESRQGLYRAPHHCTMTAFAYASDYGPHLSRSVNRGIDYAPFNPATHHLWGLFQHQKLHVHLCCKGCPTTNGATFSQICAARQLLHQVTNWEPRCSKKSTVDQ